MNYNIIVAVCENNGIGINNKIPWFIKEDLKFFSKITKGNNNNAIIMGRNTFETLPNGFLPKRDNLILSSSLIIDEKKENIIIKSFDSLNKVIDFCNYKKYEQVWIIGGQLVYENFLRMNIIDKVYLTKIKKYYECDKFFYLSNDWKVKQQYKLENSSDIETFIYIYEK